jgi:hypothetical protein
MLTAFLSTLKDPDTKPDNVPKKSLSADKKSPKGGKGSPKADKGSPKAEKGSPKSDKGSPKKESPKSEKKSLERTPPEPVVATKDAAFSDPQPAAENNKSFFHCFSSCSFWGLC